MKPHIAHYTRVEVVDYYTPIHIIYLARIFAGVACYCCLLLMMCSTSYYTIIQSSYTLLLIYINS